MSSEPAVSLRGVGKVYRLFDRRADSLRHILFRRWGRSYGSEFWALRDVSFEVRKGESVGIIGKNGSGKSTLLQLIAGILKPSAGSLSVQGRVAALLELGSGFNPEFTGRENVYLNAALFGMTRREIAERFAEVAEFAAIGDYVDQPVKFYSSGMALRLAFAVQVVVPKDILIVDEALAVGDEAFQAKCMRAITRFRESGTVLFVSHNLRSVASACDRCVLLANGALVADGEPKHVIDLYHKLLYGAPDEQKRTLETARTHGWLEAAGRSLKRPEREEDARREGADWRDPTLAGPGEVSYGSRAAEIEDVGFFTLEGQRANVLAAGRRCELRYRVRFLESVRGVAFGMTVTTPDGIQVAVDSSAWHGRGLASAAAGSCLEVRFAMQLNLTPGVYYLTTGVVSMDSGELTFLHRRVDVLAFRVHDPAGTARAGLSYLASDCSVVAVTDEADGKKTLPI